MKKNLLTRVFGTIAVAGFLFSCSSPGDLTIEKRRYRDGFYVSKSSSRKTEKAEQKAIVSHEAITSRDVKQLSSEVTPQGLTQQTIQPVANSIVATAPVSEKAVAQSVEATPTVAKTALSKNIARQAAKHFLKKNRLLPNSVPAGDDTEILIIVLCILLPPVAVYLIKDGIDQDFWINLVLTLLCGLPGIIHAFIVFSKNK